MKTTEQQLEDALEEVAALKRMVAGREETIGTLRDMVRRAAREMRAGSHDILADLEKVKS